MYLHIIVFLSLLYQISLKGNTILVTLYALHLNANATLLGIIIATGSLFPMLIASLVGRLVDRIQLKFLLVTGMFGTGVSLMIPYFSPGNLYSLIGVQLSFGLFQIITIVSFQNLIGSISSDTDRTKNYSAYTLSVSIANFIGPIVAGFTIECISYETAYLLLGICAMMPVLYFLFMKDYPDIIQLKDRNESKSFKSLLLDSKLQKVFLTSGVILTGVGLFEFYFPIYTESLGFSASTIGFLVSMNAVAFIISRLMMAKLQRKYTAEQIMGACLIIGAVAYFFIPFMKTAPLLAITVFVLGLGLGCCQPLSIVMAYNHSPVGQSGEVLGIRLTVNKAVQFIVPIIFGSVSFLGFFLIFWFNTALLSFGGKSLFKRDGKK
ncbi:MFS transporter [Lysinibacillus sp. NPDC097287]|uniref:MFS transporter n=1 Tax=Lysinibacillus sp. NPDC097287 TaxID=3364144 RepID=UPI00381C8C26